MGLIQDVLDEYRMLRRAFYAPILDLLTSGRELRQRQLQAYEARTEVLASQADIQRRVLGDLGLILRDLRPVIIERFGGDKERELEDVERLLDALIGSVESWRLGTVLQALFNTWPGALSCTFAYEAHNVLILYTTAPPERLVFDIEDGEVWAYHPTDGEAERVKASVHLALALRGQGLEGWFVPDPTQ